jgi:hypothetical protein
MKQSRFAQITLLLLIAANLMSCSSTVIVSTPAATQQSTFADPFAYCAAVGTIDAPDARYTGAKMPEAVARGLMKATNAPADAPLDVFIRNSFWRCVNGKVYACTVGANLPCESKANTSKTPNEGMTAWCQSNPSADFIPAVDTGHDTIYAWRCTNGTPVIVKQIFTVDARGFISEIWYPVNPR